MKKLKSNPFIKVTRSLKKKWNAIQRKGSRSPSSLKRERNFCISRYCNPTCKDTLITEKKDTAAMKKEFKAYLNTFAAFKPTQKNAAKDLNSYKSFVRKTVKKYKQPLENGFYKGLLSSEIKMLKDSGATSACTTELQRHIKDYSLWSRFKRDLKSGSMKETVAYLAPGC